MPTWLRSESRNSGVYVNCALARVCDNRCMKRIMTIAVAAAMLPTSAFAQTATAAQLQAQIQSMLAQVAQLQKSAGGSGAATSATSGGSSATNSANCPTFSRTLKKGMSGTDVTQLQRFLAQDPTVYPEGTISGYFGALTEAAVQRWQAKNNIVSSGTPATTGYGVVGPHTAAAIALLCGQGSATVTAKVGGYIQVSPISGNAPLTTNVQATVNATNSCDAATYILDWGDDSTPTQIPVDTSTCIATSQAYSHTYTTAGMYQIVLSVGAHRTTAQVSVY